MQLLELSLNNFRNYHNETFKFHPRFNVILGRNAQGKTNLLEAIFYLGLLQSFRTHTSREMIGFESSSSLVQALVGDETCQNKIRIQLEERRRLIQVNGKRPNLFRDYYGLLPVLLFEPKDVYLFRASPSVRRKYLARALFLGQPATAKIHRDYEELVMQKNRLLKEAQAPVREDQLEIWNERIVEIGSQLMTARLLWIREVNSLLCREHQGVAGQGGVLKLDYISALFSGHPEAKTEGSPERSREFLPLRQAQGQDDRQGGSLKKEIAQLFRETLEKRKDEEVRRRESLVGPHRDDWAAYLGGRLLGTHGSQGENRSAVIALKSAEIHLYERDHGVPPLFLLDDVASELDQARTKALFGYLQETRGQVFLTTTEESPLYQPFEKAGHSFLIEEGKGRMLG